MRRTVLIVLRPRTISFTRSMDRPHELGYSHWEIARDGVSPEVGLTEAPAAMILFAAGSAIQAGGAYAQAIASSWGQVSSRDEPSRQAQEE